MCGRIRVPEDYSELKIDLKLHEITGTFDPPYWNVPPTSLIPCIRSKNGVRRLEPMRWGLIPSWARDEKIGFSSFNARADTVETKPAFRGAWKAGRRCLVVTNGFYEWRKSDKQPFAVALGNKGPMLMAGLYENWRSSEGAWIRSCAIITTEANGLIAPIHDRMPVVLGPGAVPAWLGEEPATVDALKALLVPYPPERMMAWPVDRRVGNVQNEGPDLAEPLTLGVAV
jgi:putative SOS response-associated peptidase YedK